MLGVFFGRLNVRHWQAQLYLSQDSGSKQREYIIENNEVIRYKNITIINDKKNFTFSIAVDQTIISSLHLWTGDILNVPKGPWRKELKKLYRKLQKDSNN